MTMRHQTTSFQLLQTSAEMVSKAAFSSPFKDLLPIKAHEEVCDRIPGLSPGNEGPRQMDHKDRAEAPHIGRMEAAAGLPVVEDGSKDEGVGNHSRHHRELDRRWRPSLPEGRIRPAIEDEEIASDRRLKQRSRRDEH